MYTITVNNETFTFTAENDAVLINNKPAKWDLYRIDDRHVHILMNNVSYRAEIVATDYAAKTFTFKINNALYTVGVKDRFDILLHELGMDKVAVNKVNHITAPMPGLVLRSMVEQGQAVKKGDSILVLEAMKMENIIKAPGDGVVKNIKVQPRQAVEKGEILVEME